MPYDRRGRKISVETALVLLARCLFRDIKRKESKPAYYTRGTLYFILTGSFSLLILGTIVILVSELFGQYMPHFDYIDSDDEDDEDDTTYTSASLSPVTATPEKKALGSCVYCLYPIEGKELQTCTECGGHACLECIRTLFLIATKNESCMPPRCCGKAIPLAVGRQVLTGTELETFKEKHEEWNTAGRCYCPVPRCSAFLPPSMFPELRASFSGERSSVIGCPQCDAEVCTSCVREVHPARECIKDNNMDPELTRALEEINAKQCPKCCAATEKDGDCSSMRCWCGANWCWYCRRTVNSCILWPCENIQKQLADIEDKTCSSWGDVCFDNASATDDNDIKTIPFPEFVDYSSDELEEEADSVRQDPDIFRIVPFDCLHEWRVTEHWEFNVELQFECERCWSQVYPFASPCVRSSGDCDYSRIYKRPKVKKDLDLLGDSIMFTCGKCSLFVCNSCRKDIEAGQ